ncbi:MAG: hypothetical protein V1754_02105 [Pseudomonadota bacterium]
MSEDLKLNLGCGQNFLPGYINVDKEGEPDFRFDLETFPWPWANNSAQEVVLHHVLEHLGETTNSFLSIMKELYRICRPDAVVKIVVPHPRHDSFLSDPTHVRAINETTISLFSKAKNLEWKRARVANSPLALYLGVEFEIKKLNFELDEPWYSKFELGKLDRQGVFDALARYNNVAHSISMELKVVKG